MSALAMLHKSRGRDAPYNSDHLLFFHSQESPPLPGGKENLASEKKAPFEDSISQHPTPCSMCLAYLRKRVATASAGPGGSALRGAGSRDLWHDRRHRRGDRIWHLLRRSSQPHAHGLCCLRRARTGTPESWRPADIRPGRKRSGHQARRACTHFRQEGKTAQW